MTALGSAEAVCIAGGPLTGAEVIDPAPVALNALKDGADEDLRGLLALDHPDLDDLAFVLADVPMTVLAGAACDPEDYLWTEDEDEDAEETYGAVLALADAYTADAAAVTPVVIGRSVINADLVTVYDGFHRLSAARHAGLDRVRCHVLVASARDTVRS